MKKSGFDTSSSYLIAQNGDSAKSEIAFAQTYFAVQTRRAELIEQHLLEAERVQARQKLKQTESELSAILLRLPSARRSLPGIEATLELLHYPHDFIKGRRLTLRPTASFILAQGIALGGGEQEDPQAESLHHQHDLATAYEADLQPAIQSPSITQGGAR